MSLVCSSRETERLNSLMFLMLFASIPKVLKTESSPLAGKFLKRMLKSAYNYSNN